MAFYSTFVLLLMILVTSLAFVDRHNFFSMLIMSAFPFGDVASDLQYITFNSFYNLPLFVFCMMYSLTHSLTHSLMLTHALIYLLTHSLTHSLTRFFFLPLLFFANLVFHDKKALPKPGGYDFIWLRLSKHQPMIQGEPCSWSRDSSQGATAIYVNYVIFLVLLLVQCVYVVIAVAFASVWFVFGYFLYMCKMLSLGKPMHASLHVYTLIICIHRRASVGYVVLCVDRLEPV